MALAAALLACGRTADDPTAGTTGWTDLIVTLDRGDGSAATTWTLTCDPAGGDHPSPGEACAWLATVPDLEPDPFAPVGPDVACTEIYGGPQTATVTGSLDGEAVKAAFSRTNGCEIARWDAAQPLLVEPGGV